MEKDYYLLGEILWGMKDYFRNPNQFDYLKKFLKIDKKRCVGASNGFHFYLTDNYMSDKNRDLRIGGGIEFTVVKGDNNNYIIGSASPSFPGCYKRIYKSNEGTRIYDDDFGICIKPEMMREFHEEYTKIMELFNSVRDYKIDLGSFDGLEHCVVEIIMGHFGFLAGNFPGTPQYERDERMYYMFYGNRTNKIFFYNEVEEENVLDTVLKILTIKVPKKLLHNFHQQMIENSGVLNNPAQTIRNIISESCILVEKIDYEVLEKEIAKKLTKK